MKRLGMALIAVMALTTAVWAEPTKPAVEIRVKPVGEMAAILEYGGELFGQADAGKQFAGILKQFATDEKGFDGIDLNRPIGAYVYVAKELEDTTFVLMVPVADADSVVAAMGGKLGLDPKKGDGGLYSVEVPNVPGTVYFRFNDKYAYVTLRNEKAIDPKAVIAPKTFFAEKVTGILSAAVNIDALPEDMKKLAYGQLEMQLKEQQSKLAPNATQKLMNEFLTDVGVDAAKTILLDGERFSFTLDIDPKTDDVKLNFGLSAKSGSTLAKTLAGFADRESAAAGAAWVSNPLSNSGLNFQLPPETTKKFAKLMDALTKQTIDDAKESDRPVVKLLLDAVMPTLKAGDFQLGFLATAPKSGSKLPWIATMKTVQGNEIAKVAKGMALMIPKEQGGLQADVESIGERKLHKLTLKNQSDNPFVMDTTWAMTSDDMIAVAADPTTDPLKALIATKPTKTPMLFTEMSVARIMTMAGAPELKPETAQKLVTDVFGTSKPDGRDTMKFILSGGKNLNFAVTMKGKAVALMAAFDKAKKEQ